MITTYTTKSGSVYEVQDTDTNILKVRKIASGAGQEGRCTTGDTWKEATQVGCEGIGQPLVIYWGSGIDEYSPEDADPDCNARFTTTTPVVSIGQIINARY